MERIVQTSDITIYQGKAEMWRGPEHIDLVLTNPYGYLPLSLSSHPMVIHQWVHRKAEAEEWASHLLDHCVGTWNDGREAFWSANLPEITVDISEYKPEPGGWYPEAMVRKLLMAFAVTGQTIWDGFMGRGTVAKICREQNLKYVGVEELPKHIALALDYLELTP
jgi:hypothetical protein